MGTTMQAARLRRDRRDLFHTGSYTPLHATGAKREHVLAFAREHNGRVAIVATPRLRFTLAGAAIRPPLGELWDDTELPVPGQTTQVGEHVFTGEKVRAKPG